MKSKSFYEKKITVIPREYEKITIPPVHSDNAVELPLALRQTISLDKV